MTERRSAQHPAAIVRVAHQVGQVGLAETDPLESQRPGESDSEVVEPARHRRRVSPDDLRRIRHSALLRSRYGRTSPSRWPPSITIVSPVIHAAASEARNTTAAATSSGSPIRFSAVDAATCGSWSFHSASASRVRTTPGATALTRIFGESSSASCLVR